MMKMRRMSKYLAVSVLGMRNKKMIYLRRRVIVPREEREQLSRECSIDEIFIS